MWLYRKQCRSLSGGDVTVAGDEDTTRGGGTNESFCTARAGDSRTQVAATVGGAHLYCDLLRPGLTDGGSIDGT